VEQKKKEDPLQPIEYLEILFIFKRVKEADDPGLMRRVIDYIFSRRFNVHLAFQTEEIEVYFYDRKNEHPDEPIYVGKITQPRSMHIILGIFHYINKKRETDEFVLMNDKKRKQMED